MKEPRPSEYKCAACGGVFRYCTAEGEAEAEFQRDFPGTPASERAIICDDCYRKLDKKLAKKACDAALQQILGSIRRSQGAHKN